MKKYLLWLSVLVISISLIATFCKVVLATEAIEKTKLVFIFQGGDPEEEFYRGLMKEYREINPNVNVEFQVIDYERYIEGLMAMKGGGSQIDVILANGQAYTTLVEVDLLLDITDKIGFWDRFYDAMLDFYEIGGRKYAVPSEIGYVQALYYNQRIFDEYGLKVPETLEELVEVGKVLQGKNIIPIALADEGVVLYVCSSAHIIDQALGNNLIQLTYDILRGKAKFTNPGLVKGYEKVLEMHEKGLHDPYYISNTWERGMTSFTNGRAAMIIEGNWSLSDLLEFEADNPESFKLGWASIPRCFEGVEGRPISAPGAPLSVYSDSKNIEESIKLIDFLTSDENATRVCIDAATNLSPNKNVKVEMDEPLTTLANQMALDFANGFVFWEWVLGLDLSGKLSEEIAKAAIHQQTVEEALQSVQEYFDARK